MKVVLIGGIIAIIVTYVTLGIKRDIRKYEIIRRDALRFVHDHIYDRAYYLLDSIKTLPIEEIRKGCQLLKNYPKLIHG